MDNIDKKIKRPLSPHLQVYKLPITALMSISNRISGVLMIFGILMLLWLLIGAATGRDAYEYFMDFASSNIGKIMIFGWSVALFYHMCNGIRHLIWDTGRMFEKNIAEKSGYIVIFATVILTIATWYCALN